MNTKKKIRFAAVASAVISILALSSSVLAQNTPVGLGGKGITYPTSRNGVTAPPPIGIGKGIPGRERNTLSPGVFGTVDSVSGTTLIVTSKVAKKDTIATTYTIDASVATVTKNGAVSSVSAIEQGDMIMAQGTVSGTSVTAKIIRAISPQKQGTQKTATGKENGSDNRKPKQMGVVVGNGQPIIGGNVTGINGNTITFITTKGSITYTVDASGASVVKNGTAGTVSSISVGDAVVTQGSVSGTSIIAIVVVDQGVHQDKTNNSITKTGTPQNNKKGVITTIGGFFKKLFNFF